MNPTKHSRSLYFTPRTPWGRYPQNRPGQNYLRASEDKPLDPSGKNMQGLGGQKAPDMQSQTLKGPPAAQKTPYDPRPASDRDIVRQHGDVAPSVKEQLQRDIDWNRKQGYASNSSLTPPQMIERNNLMREVFPDRPEASSSAQKEKHWSGSIGGDGVRGPKDGADLTQGVIQYSSQPGVQKADAQKQNQFQRTPKYPEQIDQREHEEAKNPEDIEEEAKK